jgi:DNA invertase Pin-like site-specific DNA recombinase
VTRLGAYCRVSTPGQSPAAQLDALRTFAAARGWAVTEFIDHGVSGAKERRPALDDLLTAVRARKVDVVACTKLDRLARSTRHLVNLGDEFKALGVDLVVLDQAIDTTTTSGRLTFNVLAAIAAFERDLMRERVAVGFRDAQANGTRSGRPIGRPRRLVDAEEVRHRRAAGESWRKIAKALKTPVRTLRRHASAWQKPGGELCRALPLAVRSRASEEDAAIT